MNKTVYVFIAMALLLGLAVGCQAPAPTQAPAQPTTAGQPATQAPAPTAAPASSEPAAVNRPLTVAVKTETITLDPHECDYDYCQKPQHGAYEALLKYEMKDDQTTVGPSLATGYETDDGKVWTLTLREGVKFTDGTPFNAEAVKYNFDRVLGINKVPAGRIPAIEEITVVDEYTVRITLENVFLPFDETLTKLYMVSPTAAKEHATSDDPWGNKWLFDHAVGTGPYLIDSWVKGQTVTLVKNPDYWGGWDGNHVEKIVLRFVPESSTRRLLLENGEVDLAEGIPNDDLDALSKVPGVVVQAYEQPSLIQMRFRLQGYLKDARVRRAIELAFDYEAFIDGVLGGLASYPRGPVPPVVWVFDDTIPEAKQDMEAAKELLAEAGYPNGGFSLTIATISPYGWFQPREAQILQDNLKELGITATIQDYPDAGAYFAAMSTADKGPDIYAWTVNYSLNDPVSELGSFHSRNLPKNGGSGYMLIDSPEIDGLVEAAETEASRDKRLAIYKEMQQLMVKDSLVLNTALPLYVVTMRDSIQGYTWIPFSINGSYEWYDLWLSK